MKEPREQFQPERAGLAQESEREKRAGLLARFIETRVIGTHECLGAKDEKEIRKYYEGLTPRERADALYSKVMAYVVDRQAEEARSKEVERRGGRFEPEKPDPYFISEIGILYRDPAVRELFPSLYGEARIDAKNFRVSELADLWRKTVREIREKEHVYTQLERDLHLEKIAGAKNISGARSRMALLANNLFDLEQRKRGLETLEGYSKTAEHTDAAAMFHYETFKGYKDQLAAGFVWLPTRRAIHAHTVSAILNHRWPVLIGEAGSGKSDQADAAAVELTGHRPTEIECEATTGEPQLIKDKVIASQAEGGESYDEYGALMRAFTGYDDSRQQEPAVKTGRIARFDEAGRLGPKAYSIIKKARQRAPSDDFYGRPVLPGAGAIWTSNPVGPRYPDRRAPDPAMRRELAEIPVDYPEMTIENPELYEFMLAALADENYHIAVAKEELAPHYDKKKEIPEDQREVLQDGSIVIAKDEIVNNMADGHHGALWRFGAAIKALQDSFVYGNGQTEKYPDTLLRFKEDAERNIEVTTDGSGEPLTLSTSTVTLGELASWMTGFNERRQKQNAEFRVDTLTEWLNFKVNTYLAQADKADKEKLKAIFRHFGFLDKSVIPDLRNALPLTPKEIGYLSPRTPRPVYVEKPPPPEGVKTHTPRPATKEAKEYETRQVFLEDGSTILMKVRAFTLENGVFDGDARTLVPLEVAPGKRFAVKGESFVFAGVIEDESNPHHGQPIGQPAHGENLYKVFVPAELRWGIIEEFTASLGQDVENLAKDIEDFCRAEKQ